jgi:ABC-type uncharacterized transport system involved in gliding motility auxiliary subunit
MQMTQQDQSSNLDRLLRSWGLQMSANTFAGDRALAIEAPLSRNQRAEKVIGFLGLTADCFNKGSVISTNLNQLRLLFAGVLNEVDRADGGSKRGRRPQPGGNPGAKEA